MFTLKDSTDVEDLVVGTTILGTGGGGSPQKGKSILESDLAHGLELQVIELEEIPDDGLVVSPYYVGSLSPAHMTKKRIITDPFKVGFGVMERYFGRKIAGTVACELGGGNTAAALHVVAQLGIPLVNGDLSGRSGPELHQNTAQIFGLSMAPSVLVTETGNVVFVEQYANIDDYETLARHVSVAAGGLAAVIDSPLTKPRALQIIIRATISKSLTVGEAVRNAHEKNTDPVEAVKRVLDGWLIFEGSVERHESRDDKGFLFAEVTLSGRDKWQGRSFRSWIKNEHIFAWLNGEPVVMPPDLIIFLDSAGNGITNDLLKRGLQVSVVAAKAPEVWRTPRGLEFFGPRHFGFTHSYVPVEKLVCNVIG